MTTRFVAFDVETANADLASICQIGVVSFEDGRVSETWETLIDPDDFFDPANVGIHGICAESVRNAPKFPEVFARLGGYLTGHLVAHHTGFDKVSLARVTARYDLPAIDCRWLDTARVVRRTWLELSQRGYGLANVARTLGIEFRHHSAGEDARAAGEILLCAIDHSSVGLEEWVTKSVQYDYHTNRQGDREGPLCGEVLVFTGSLAITRKEAADMAARAGCDVAEGVTKGTTILVVGKNDIGRLAGHEKSGKHRKAEGLIAKGQSLRILAEDDFARLIEMN